MWEVQEEIRLIFAYSAAKKIQAGYYEKFVKVVMFLLVYLRMHNILISLLVYY